MKLFFGIFITQILLLSTLFGTEFADMEQISLKKDEQTKIFVKYAHYTKVFKFRWTLYVNEGLIMFNSYNKRVGQHILYLNTTNQSFKVKLKPQSSESHEAPYFLVKFTKFDEEKKKAHFELFLSDSQGQIEVQYPKKK